MHAFSTSVLGIEDKRRNTLLSNWGPQLGVFVPYRTLAPTLASRLRVWPVGCWQFDQVDPELRTQSQVFQLEPPKAQALN